MKKYLKYLILAVVIIFIIFILKYLQVMFAVGSILFAPPPIDYESFYEGNSEFKARNAERLAELLIGQTKKEVNKLFKTSTRKEPLQSNSYFVGVFDNQVVYMQIIFNDNDTIESIHIQRQDIKEGLLYQ